MLTLGHFFAVGIGAAFGAIARWLLGLWLNSSGAFWSWGTLAANLTGGYLIGLALGFMSLYPEIPDWLKLTLTTGFLGGLTTFSTFSAETVGLLERGAYASALAYVLVSVAGSLTFTAVGLMTVHAWR